MSSTRTITAAAEQPAPAFSQANRACLLVRTSFNFVVHCSYAEAAPLFGPIGERVWAGEQWDPVFIHPQPARDVQGAVFTVSRGASTEVWINTRFNMDERHFQYVYFISDLSVTVIDVRFYPASADRTEVNVDFTRTAITPQGNQSVTAMTEVDKTAAARWQQAIDEYLASRKNQQPQLKSIA